MGRPSPMQVQVRRCYVASGISYSENKTIVGVTKVTPQGSTVDGVIDSIRKDGARTLPLLLFTIWPLSFEERFRKALQIVMGRCVQHLIYHRPLFAAVNQCWKLCGQPVAFLAPRASGEFSLPCASVLHMESDLRAPVKGRVTAPDVSEMGGGSRESVFLRPEAERLLSAAATPTE